VTDKWIPKDDELDAVARSMAAPGRDAERIEQERTNILARATGLAQHKRMSRVPAVAAIATAFAAAAAVLIWIVARPSEQAPPKELITAIGPAQFERTSAWPDFSVRLDDGSVAIQVAHLASSERFRATTSDAEIDVRGGKLIVGADHERITFVSVAEGRAEVRWAQQVIVVAAGSTWAPPRIAQRDSVELAPPDPTHAASPATTSPVETAAAPTKLVTAKTKSPRTAEAQPTVALAQEQPTAEPKLPAATTPEATQPQVEPAPRPGEADFRAGVASLRAGDAAAATRSFTSSCAAAQKDALGEDACFWVGAAAKRAGQTSTAREALTRFLASYPSSARAGEAAALLGWILYDAGELDAARQRFEIAARDRVPKVKESARKGLEAIKRKQSAPQ
jgi:TolA-binding protein